MLRALVHPWGVSVGALRRGLRAMGSVPRAAPEEPTPQPGGNSEVRGTFLNRNPRNLEKLALATKDRGRRTVWPSTQHWHRLSFDPTTRHTSARVLSALGRPVLAASTREWGLRKLLPSPAGVCAARSVARVLARRCLEAGLGHLTFRELPWRFRSESVQCFRAEMKEAGIVLSEPRRRFRPSGEREGERRGRRARTRRN
uniref:Large ribosomal subunit protein uL18m n=2 Tax=Callorhinchus milii TaxID=7868 RepID=V9LE15_CALMI|eukprot:gi/632992364/ref/XP_007885059.1/ PREDICTED: 39S ribosomal protein L18, mitochondrial [Callorhinchus milii]